MHPHIFNKYKNSHKYPLHVVVYATAAFTPSIALRDKVRNANQCETWSGYGKWSDCNNLCGVGTQVRSRRIVTVKRAIGQQCNPVRGRRQQTRICTGNLCGGESGRFTSNNFYNFESLLIRIEHKNHVLYINTK